VLRIGMVWFVFDEGNEWREAICRGPKALGTVFTGPYLSTRKIPSFIIMDTGL